MTFGEMIKAARKEAGMTQAELADKLGIKYQSVSRWERDIIKPKIETLFSIYMALGVEPSNLLKFLDDMRDFGETLHEEGEMTEDEYDCHLSAIEAVQKKFLSALDKLNDEGQQKALERVEELTEIPRYRRAPQQDTEKPSDAPSEGEEKP